MSHPGCWPLERAEKTRIRKNGTWLGPSIANERQQNLLSEQHLSEEDRVRYLELVNGGLTVAVLGWVDGILSKPQNLALSLMKFKEGSQRLILMG